MEVRARAPGKIILAGEHAVVHGSTAMAAAIDLYTYVSLRFPTPHENDDTLKLHLKDLDLEFSWPVGKIKDTIPDLGSTSASSPASCSLEITKAIATLVEELQIPEAKIALTSGISAFLWLYIAIHGCKPAIACVNSELPLGAGLGSSAAFCVALSAALLALSDSVKLEFSHQGWQMFGETELDLVNKWAFEGEKIIHGKPSGIDNTVSTYGYGKKWRQKPAVLLGIRDTINGYSMAFVFGAITIMYLLDIGCSATEYFKHIDALRVVILFGYCLITRIHATGNMIKFRSGELTRVKTNMPLKMLITNTKVGRNTKALVAGVSERTMRHQNAMAAVFNAVDSISNEMASIIQSPVSDDLAITEKEEKLEELMEMNQGLLQCMGVSHSSIETVLRTTLKYKLASKLTGAGGGGCVLTLLPTLLSGTVVDKVMAELESCGFKCFIAGIGGGGMEISFSGSS